MKERRPGELHAAMEEFVGGIRWARPTQHPDDVHVWENGEWLTMTEYVRRKVVFDPAIPEDRRRRWNRLIAKYAALSLKEGEE